MKISDVFKPGIPKLPVEPLALRVETRSLTKRDIAPARPADLAAANAGQPLSTSIRQPEPLTVGTLEVRYPIGPGVTKSFALTGNPYESTALEGVTSLEDAIKGAQDLLTRVKLSGPGGFVLTQNKNGFYANLVTFDAEVGRVLGGGPTGVEGWRLIGANPTLTGMNPLALVTDGAHGLFQQTQDPTGPHPYGNDGLVAKN